MPQTFPLHRSRGTKKRPVVSTLKVKAGETKQVFARSITCYLFSLIRPFVLSQRFRYHLGKFDRIPLLVVCWLVDTMLAARARVVTTARLKVTGNLHEKSLEKFAPHLVWRLGVLSVRQERTANGFTLAHFNTL